MKVLTKIEDLIFDSRVTSHVEIIKDRQVIIKARCVIEKLTDDTCTLLTPSYTRYKILGEHLQIKEYGDTYVKIVGRKIHGFLIEGDHHE